MSRRLAREKAFQMLFQIDVGRNSLEIAKQTLQEAGLSPANESFALKLVEGTCDNIKEFDSLIKKYSAQWDIERLASVDKNVIRMALFEIKYLPDVPSNVAINEAIELVKVYGSEDSGKFVNGILDSIQRDPQFMEGRKNDSRN
ncbi:MAG: transcription antitermination factor NusB [Bacillota bacterium]|nr:transcription antitermination factor NusB [Clostridia bacterium]